MGVGVQLRLLYGDEMYITCGGGWSDESKSWRFLAFLVVMTGKHGVPKGGGTSRHRQIVVLSMGMVWLLK